MRIPHHHLAFAALLLLLTPWLAGAQLVRGVVTNRQSGAPMPGVLITVHGIPSETTVSVLSNPRGEYAVRLGGPGRYMISAKRIGIERQTTAPFAVSAGETRRIDVALDPIPVQPYALPRMVVSALALCRGRDADAPRVAALWEEIRTALLSVAISSRDSLVDGRLSLFERTLHPRNLRVLSEARIAMRPISEQPFAALSADSLSRIGYWRELPGDSLALSGVDAEVLTSDAFLRDHCYRVASRRGDRAGLVGLAFEPVPDRRTTDITGTMWVDSVSSELRFVEFRYTRVPRESDAPRVGGEVHFARLPSGAWVVNHWFIRMPQFALDRIDGETRRLFDADGRRIVYQLREGGGELTGEGLASSFSSGVITGRALDSLRSALAGASIELTGTWHRTSTNTEGRFRLAQLYEGTYELTARTPGYSELGVNAVEREVTVGRRDSVAVVLRAIDRAAIRARHCRIRGSLPGSATLRVVVRDGSGSPVPHAAISVGWRNYDPRAFEARLHYAGAPMVLQQLAGEDGASVFCAIPAYSVLRVSVPGPGGSPIVREFPMARDEVSALVISVPER